MPIKINEVPSQARLRELFDYDADTGALIWRVRPQSDFKNQRACSIFNAMYSGSVAGSIDKANGSVYVTIDAVRFLAHRLAYTYVHGVCPVELQIDHVNGNRLDNRIENLRLATAAENMQNVGKHRDNSSGHRGVHWCKQSKKFIAQVQANGKRKRLGSFNTAEEAAAVYAQAAKQLHGAFMRSSVGAV